MNLPANRTALGVIGVFVASIVLWFGGGIVGVLASGVLFVLWYLTPASYAVTFGQVALATLVFSTQTPLAVAVGEAGLIAVLIGPLGMFEDARFRSLVGIGCIAVTAIGIWAVYVWRDSLWLPSIILIVFLVLAWCGLQWYDTSIDDLVRGDLGT